METVTPSRLGAELRLLLGEPQPPALLALEELGVGERLLGPGFSVDAEFLAEALALSPPDARADLVALGAVCDWRTPDLNERLRRLGFAGREVGVVRAAVALGRILDALEDDDAAHRPPLPDGIVDAVLARKPLEIAVLAAAAGETGSEAARRWLRKLRHQRLEITGDDLLAAGLRGPDVGRALAAARAAMLDGRAPDRESQLAVALAA